MKLKDLNSKGFLQLCKLSKIKDLLITDPSVTNSIFYSAIQEQRTLDASDIADRLTPSALLLVARIAAKVANLVTIDFSHNNLGENGAEIARALAQSYSISIVNYSYNNLLDDVNYMKATACAFSTSAFMHRVNLNDHLIDPFSIEFITPYLHNITSKHNELLNYYSNSFSTCAENALCKVTPLLPDLRNLVNDYTKFPEMEFIFETIPLLPDLMGASRDDAEIS